MMRLVNLTLILLFGYCISCSKADRGTEIPEGHLELVWAVQPEGAEGEQPEEPWFGNIRTSTVSDKYILVMDWGRHAVLQLDHLGYFVRFIGGQGGGPGEFGDNPSNISISQNGQIFLNHQRNYISIFSSEGEFIERLNFEANPNFVGRVRINHFALDDSTIVWTVGPSRRGLELEYYLNEPFLIATRGEDSFGTRPL